MFGEATEILNGTAELAKDEKMRNPIGFSAYLSRFDESTTLEGLRFSASI